MTTHQQPASLAERRTAFAAARQSLRGLSEVVHQASGAELPELLGELDEIVALTSGGRVAVVAEASARGEISASQAGSATAWVMAHAPSLRAGGAGQVVRCVEAFTKPANGFVRRAVLDGRLAVPVSLTVLSEFDRLSGRLADEAKPTVLAALVDIGSSHGARAVRELRPRLLATYGESGEFQDEQDRAARHIALSQPVQDDDVFHYQLTLDAESKSALESAIGPLSAPAPGPDGSRDPRSSAQRRGQALMSLCRRGAAAGTGTPGGVKAALFVTMSLEDLRARTGAGMTVGSADSGTLLAPETVRKIACDSGVIPVVLGADSQIVDMGKQERFFTTAQVKTLWLRDRQCTFAGCTTPAHWCDAHHTIHWADGGLTDIDTAALLCGRHHSVVHRDRLAAHVTPTGVHWDTTPGSYDQTLHGRDTQPPETAPHGASDPLGGPARHDSPGPPGGPARQHTPGPPGARARQHSPAPPRGSGPLAPPGHAESIRVDRAPAGPDPGPPDWPNSIPA